MKTIAWKTLKEFGITYLEKKGVSHAHAEEITELAVQTEAMGVRTHGMAFYTYFEQAIPDDLVPEAEPVLVKEKGPTALIDGNSGFSQLSLLQACSIGLEKVQKYGTAVIAGRNCSWLAALGTYLLPISEEGYLAQLWAQTSTCKDAAPFGGYDPRFSTNPIALSFPTSSGLSLSDISTTSISMGRVNKMIEDGEQASEAIFLNSQGVLSKNPRDVIDGGSILFLGGQYLGHKGYGLSLFNEALAANAGGSCNNPASKMRQSFTLIIIDPEAFGGTEYYEHEIQRFIDHVKSSRKRPGFSEIRLPGERRMQLLEVSRAKGIVMEDTLVEKLNQLAQRYSLPEIR
jgi:LDH2 family malate/lactate/ureidoglycolate dehydrogenase